jgi:hypothetical protein
LASAPAFLPGQQGDRAERPTKWEMIHNFLCDKNRVQLPAISKKEAIFRCQLISGS